LSGGIAARMQALEAHPEWLAVIGDCYLTKENGEVYHKSGTLAFAKRNLDTMQHPEKFKRELILRWWVPGPTLVVRKEAYTVLGFYDEHLKIEDRDMYLRLLSKNALGYVNYPVAFYRFGSERFRAPSNATTLEADALSDRKNAFLFTPPLSYFLLLRARMQSSAALFKQSGSRFDWLLWKSYTLLFRITQHVEKILGSWL
jgi:hypothetical protein